MQIYIMVEFLAVMYARNDAVWNAKLPLPRMVWRSAKTDPCEVDLGGY